MQLDTPLLVIGLACCACAGRSGGTGGSVGESGESDESDESGESGEQDTEFESCAAVEFADPLVEEAVRDELDLPVGDIPGELLGTLSELTISPEDLGSEYIGPFSLQGLECALGLHELNAYYALDGPDLLAPITELPALEVLRLSGGSIESLAPLANIETLVFVELWEWDGDGDLSALAGLPNLRTVWLNDTAVDSLASLAGAPALQTLNLSGTQVSDLSPLSTIPSLETLDIRRTPVLDLSPLAGHPSLESLDASSTLVEDPSSLGPLPHLRYLSFQFSALTTLGSLNDMPEGTTLNLRSTAVLDIGPLAGWQQLEVLSLPETGAPIDLSPLEGLPLRTLRAVNSGLTDLSVLATLPTPRFLNLTHNDITELDALVGLDWWVPEGECADLLLTGNPLSSVAIELATTICEQTHISVRFQSNDSICDLGQSCLP